MLVFFFFCFGRGVPVAHGFFWEGDPCYSSFFVLGGGSVLLIVFCFGKGIGVAHRFLFWECDPCCSSFFTLGGDLCSSVL